MLFLPYFLNFKPYFLQNIVLHSFFFLFFIFLIIVSPLPQLCNITSIYIFTHVSVRHILFLILPLAFHCLFLILICVMHICILISVIFIHSHFIVAFYIKVAHLLIFKLIFLPWTDLFLQLFSRRVFDRSGEIQEVFFRVAL